MALTFSSPVKRGRWRDAQHRDGGGVRPRPYSHPFRLNRQYSHPITATIPTITAG